MIVDIDCEKCKEKNLLNPVVIYSAKDGKFNIKIENAIELKLE